MAATKKTKAGKPTSGMSKIDEEEAIINFRYGLGAMLQMGDKEGLAKAKKAHPKLYADWEKRQARIEKERAKERANKTGKK